MISKVDDRLEIEEVMKLEVEVERVELRKQASRPNQLRQE